MRESIPIKAAPSRWALFTVSALTWSCTAQITGESAGAPLDSDNTPSSSSPDALPGGQLPLDRESVARACKAKGGRLDAGRTPLRRLTRSELDNSVRVLLGVEAEAALNVTPDEKMGPFYSNAVAPVDELAVEQYQELATRVAAAAAPNAPALAGCDLAQAACAETFIQTFGRRAYRRPLEASEATALLALFELGKTAGGATKAFQTVIEALLQSPLLPLSRRHLRPIAGRRETPERGAASSGRLRARGAPLVLLAGHQPRRRADESRRPGQARERRGARGSGSSPARERSGKRDARAVSSPMAGSGRSAGRGPRREQVPGVWSRSGGCGIR